MPHLTRPVLQVPHLPGPTVRLPKLRRPELHLPPVRVPRKLVHGVGRFQPSLTPFTRTLRSTTSWFRAARPAADPILLICAVVLPSVLVARSITRPDWWSDGPRVWVALTVAVAMTWIGLRWLARAKGRPRALTGRARDRIELADRRRAEQHRAARDLLDGLRSGAEPVGLWSAFSRSSGLHVPPQVRPLIGPTMEPGALVTYLSRGRDRDAEERPLWLVISVPVLAFVVPAALLVLAA